MREIAWGLSGEIRWSQSRKSTGPHQRKSRTQTYPELGWSRSGDEPWLVSNIRASFDAALGILNTETAGLARQGFLMWESHVNELRGATQPPVQVHFVVLTFNQMRDESERQRFDRMPTRLRLPPADVASVRSLAGRLLEESPEFGTFRDALGTLGAP